MFPHRITGMAVLSLLLLQCSGERRLADLEIDRKEIRVLIVGDGFTKNDQSLFDAKVPLVKSGIKLLEQTADVTFKFEIELVEAKTTSKSSLGVEHHGDPQNCYFDFKGALTNIRALQPDFAPEYFFVIFAKNGTGGGCADGNVMIMEYNARQETAAHEMGHALVGLYDERGGKQGEPPQINRTNCAVSTTDLPWRHLVDSGALANPYKGCKHYDELFRPSDKCGMDLPELNFCVRCGDLVQQVMKRRLVAPPLLPSVFAVESVANTEFQSIEVVALLTAKGTLEIIDAYVVDARQIASPIIVGDTFAVIDATSKRAGASREIIAIVPLSIDDGDESVLVSDADRLPLRARSYSGRDGRDLLVAVDARLIRFTLVAVDAKTVEARDLKLSLRRLMNPGRGELLTATTRSRLVAAPIRGQIVDVSTPLFQFLAAQQ